ncbi:MAG: gamma-glutamylcyclotransferase family protein [Myxococcota bacterium]
MSASSNTDIDALFVYGTLMPGQSRWSQIDDLVMDTQTAILQGFEMYHLPEGYPAVIEGDGEIRGQLVWPVDGARTELLETTDAIECVVPDEDNALYVRVVAGQGHARAFIYLYHPSRVDDLVERGERVPHGDWASFVEGRR